MRVAILAFALLILGSPVLETAALTPHRKAELGNGGCELVELYPGYPGYRGYVTGVDGIGDFACLQDLEEQDRTFNQVQVDGANLRSAQLLGINGGPQLWTWENWMAIESKRGLSTTCYTCLLDSNNIRPEPVGHTVLPNDPRLLLGAPFNSYDGSPNPSYTARIKYSLSESPRYLNAAELLAGINRTSTTSISGPYVDPYIGWCNALAQGGYAPTPDNAAPSDQEFLLGAAFYLIYQPGLSRFGGISASNRFDGDVTQWEFDRVQGRTTQSLAEVLRSSSLAEGC